MPRFQNWILFIVIFMTLSLLFNLNRLGDGTTDYREIPYSTFKSLLVEGAVKEVQIRGNSIKGLLLEEKNLGKMAPIIGFTTIIPSFGDDSLLPTLEKSKTRINVISEEESGIWQFFKSILPWILILGVYYWFFRQATGNMAGGVGKGGVLDRYLKAPNRDTTNSAPDVTFDDVAGQESAKREVAELVDFLLNADKYRQLGAEVPKGILLMGAPGTGKTLLARALAGEAGVPFHSISASEFIEMFVGVGASRVRDLFDRAKKSAPSIIFIDEIDSIGRVRGTGLGGGNDEREQTLNQILAELDGFTGREAVVVLAATNRPDVLDPALLRPGRFDRHVTLELPDRNARAAILQVHCRNVPLAKDIDLDVIAGSIPGFSGADIKNLVNEAAMMAARNHSKEVTAQNFNEMRDRIVMGAVRSLVIEPDEHERLAVHESGHTIAAYFLPYADPLLKVSIIPRGRSLGATQQLAKKERHLMSEEYLRDRLAVILAGRAAEKIVFDSLSSGADDDIKQATSIARTMVSRWGMDKDVGPMDVRESEEHPFLGREIAQPRQVSESTARIVDRSIRRLMTEAESIAEEIIVQHRQKFDSLVAKLETEESLDQKAIKQCLGNDQNNDGEEETPLRRKKP